MTKQNKLFYTAPDMEVIDFGINYELLTTVSNGDLEGTNPIDGGWK